MLHLGIKIHILAEWLNMMQKVILLQNLKVAAMLLEKPEYQEVQSNNVHLENADWVEAIYGNIQRRQNFLLRPLINILLKKRKYVNIV